MDKKGAELSINIMIIVILGLLVLIVMAFIFKDQIGKSTKSYGSITEKTDKCLQNPTSTECKDYLKPQSSSRFSIPRISSSTSIWSK